jgi:hypothetical protein
MCIRDGPFYRSDRMKHEEKAKKNDATRSAVVAYLVSKKATA